MPSTSQKQHDFFNAVAHSKEFADKVDVPQSVAKDFIEHDKENHLWQTPKKSKKSKRINNL